MPPSTRLRPGELVVLRKRPAARRRDGGRRTIVARVHAVDGACVVARPLARAADGGPSRRLLFVDVPSDSQWIAHALVRARV